MYMRMYMYMNMYMYARMCVYGYICICVCMWDACLFVFTRAQCCV